MVEAGARQALGPHVAHEDVGALDQAQQRGEPVRLLDVQSDRALVAVEVDELAGHAGIAAALGHGAQQVAAGRLDLDHLGAIVGERARADRADDHGREIDDAHALERTPTFLGAHLPNSSSISPHSTPGPAPDSLKALSSPRTSMKSPTHSGCTSRAV